MGQMVCEIELADEGSRWVKPLHDKSVFFFRHFETYYLQHNSPIPLTLSIIQIIIPMNSFSDFYYRTHSTKLLSFEHVFCLATYFVIFAVPFYFAFAGNNFWFDEQYAELNVKYSFTGFYAVEVSYLEAGANVLREFSNIPNSALTSLSQVTLTANQQSDSAEMVLSLAGFGARAIQSLNLIVYYNVEVMELEKIFSAGSAFSITGDISIASISGRLQVQAPQPLDGLTGKQSQTVNSPIYYTRNLQSAATYEQLMEQYILSPLTINSNIHVTSAHATVDTRTININLLKDTKAVLPYYPSILQTFKLKFSRYFGFLILSYLIFRNIMVMLIEEEGLECHQSDQVPPLKKA